MSDFQHRGQPELEYFYVLPYLNKYKNTNESLKIRIKLFIPNLTLQEAQREAEVPHDVHLGQMQALKLSQPVNFMVDWGLKARFPWSYFD